MNFLGYSFNEEIYSKLTIGVSPDVNNNTDGINSFTRFSIVNINNYILPVAIINFKAYRLYNTVQVSWTSISELNVAKYNIEHSADAINFTVLDSLPVTAAITPQKDYHYVDMRPLNGNNYYRIKAVDKDGKITCSDIASVNICNNKAGIEIYPNPVKGQIVTIQFNDLPDGNYKLILYSISNQKLLEQKIDHYGSSASYQLMFPQLFANAIYYISITGNGKTIRRKLIALSN